ncbi:uncharacterized protein LOC122368923 [Amphibalanus amphitrite]|uniref:uncharacterized protein LOC122368923 n=1 Tax=Amphibalanus amphitrite TaxID=1232801 RepID=UPI001C911777|nr:uncharacterized protein LOC122368923 [Amphibalanus amphitrite]
MEELLAARSCLRTKATKACNDLRSYREGDRASLDQDQLALKLHHVEKIHAELQAVQVQLDKQGQADETDHVQTLEDEAFLGSRLLTRLEKAEEAQFRAESMKAAGSADLKSSLTVAIPTFDGDVMRWPEFWELFSIAVHDNQCYANVQRFVVLKSHLAGAALRAIQGIPVTGDGYVQAVSALKARFDLENVRRETLLKELMNMSSVRHGDLKAMRSFIDHLSARTRALSTLGVSSESLSSLLLPMVKGNIPEDWRLEWARRSSHHFDDFLVFLKEEIRVRELARGPNSECSAVDPPATFSVTTRDLDSEHLARECLGSPCAERGRQHHSLLHDAELGTQHSPSAVSELSPDAEPLQPPEPPAPGTCAEAQTHGVELSSRHRYNVSSTGKSFLQTAAVVAAGPNGRTPARDLLDGGSDASYVRSSLALELGLPDKGSDTFACIGFHERTEQPCAYDRDEVDIESRFGGPSVKLDMKSTDVLCSPPPTAQPPRLPSEIQTADDFRGGEVDVLVAADDVHQVVLQDQLEADGLRAIDTIFDYGLKGGDSDGPHTSQCPSSRPDAADWDASPTGIHGKEMCDSHSNPQLMSEKLHEPPPIWGSDERPTYGRCSRPSWCREAPSIVGLRPIPSVQRKHPGGIWRWHRWRRRG